MGKNRLVQNNWDENLHSFVQAEGGVVVTWLVRESDVWRNCVHLGYWAHWVKEKEKQYCMKFMISTNPIEEFEWPLDNPDH